MKTVRRRSRQRERIYEFIRSRMDHPTAHLVYEALKREMPSLSLGNVYRNITILVEEGRITRRDFGDGIEHYDAIPGLHYHFICDTCKTVTDFPMPLQDLITKKARELTRHCISGHTIQFFGTCDKCRKRKKR
ncbi:MAG TPA: transcriptional repressor [Spirochaetota bacterium]|nr:transcriptional repressor [Spirochaetota bacterium]